MVNNMADLKISVAKVTALRMSRTRGKRIASSVVFVAVTAYLSLSILLQSSSIIPEPKRSLPGVHDSSISSYLPEGLPDEIIGVVLLKPSDTQQVSLGFGTSDTQQRAALLDSEKRTGNSPAVATITTDTREVLPDAGGGTICFVTSIFGNDEKKADKPLDVRKLFPDSRSSSDYDFILFTNMENVTANGWKQIVKKDLPYRRFITQSRWGKFVGWRDEGLSHCGLVIYFDGYVVPVDKEGLEPFQKLADQVIQSEAGIAQVTHFWDGRKIDWIFGEILKTNKDVPTNVKASMKWFKEQPDFNNKFPYYLNKWFGKFSRDRSFYYTGCLSAEIDPLTH
jgi:hypothetical protein